MFGIARSKYGFRSQNSKKRRRPIIAKLIKHESEASEVEILLDSSDLPLHYFALPVFGIPGMTWKVSYKELCANDRLRCEIRKDDAENALAIGGGKVPVTMPSLKYDQNKFARFLAKVAHSYACAVAGKIGFAPCLRDFIKHGHSKPRLFIGGEREVSSPRNTVFEIGLGTFAVEGGTTALAVRMRFLAFLGTPTYIAVVAEDFQQPLSLIRSAAHERFIKVSITDVPE